MKVRLHVDMKGYKRKPHGREIGGISKRIVDSLVTVTPEKLADMLGNGQTAVLAELKGERKKDNIVQQQVLMLDFDNTETVVRNGKRTVVDKEGMLQRRFEDILDDEFIQKHASFIYKTLNHSEKVHKFRVVFILDEPLTNSQAVQEAYSYLFSKFDDADTSCQDPSRLFFGGKEVVEVDFNNTLKVSQLPLGDVQKPEVTNTKPSLERAREAKPVIQGDGTETWKLIKAGETEEVKKRLSVYSAKLHSKVQAVNYLVSLDMRDVLGIYHNPAFDIFHYENSPSASIFQMENSDIWLYKCHSASHQFTGDLILVVAELLPNGTYMSALRYLIDVCNIEIVMTDKVKELRDQCDLWNNILLSESLKSSYPAIHSRFGRYKAEIKTILDLFKENVYEDEAGELRCLTWMSVRRLSEKIYGTPTKKDKISRILNLLCYTNWIEKLDESQIPEDLLKKIKETQKANNREKRSNVFELLKKGEDFFKKLNMQCEEMKENGFTVKGFSKEYVQRTDGTEKADKVFVQDKDRKISSVSDAITKDIVSITMKMIEKNGFAPEKDVLAQVIKKWKSKGFSDYKFKQMRAEMMQDYGLERKRLTKDLREKFKAELPPKSMPVVFIKAV